VGYTTVAKMDPVGVFVAFGLFTGELWHFHAGAPLPRGSARAWPTPPALR
jgi:hypothetical protein